MADPRPRRVLYCEVCEDGTVGGSHQILFDQACGLEAARYEPVVLFYEDNRYVVPLRERGIPVHVWTAERRRERAPHEQGRRLGKLASLCGAVLRRARLLRREGIDLVQLNNSPSLGDDDWLPAARLAGAACIAQCVGQPYALPRGAIRRRLRLGFDRIVPISEHIAHELRAGGFPEAKLRTIVAGIDVEAFAARVARSPEAVRDGLDVARDQTLAVMVGNLREWKGQGRVLQALSRLAPEIRARLVVSFVGEATAEDAGYEAGLRATVAREGLEPAVRFLGSRTDVPDLVNAADLVLHASVFPEPFGLVIVEGLCLGKPVVAARRGGPVEILREGCGFLHDPDDPRELAALLARLVREPGLGRRVGERARERARDFDLRRILASLQELYDEVLAGRS